MNYASSINGKGQRFGIVFALIYNSQFATCSLCFWWNIKQPCQRIISRVYFYCVLCLLCSGSPSLCRLFITLNSTGAHWRVWDQLSRHSCGRHPVIGTQTLPDPQTDTHMTTITVTGCVCHAKLHKSYKAFFFFLLRKSLDTGANPDREWQVTHTECGF